MGDKMPGGERDKLRKVKTFPLLVGYLRDELDWALEAGDFEELTFDYEPEELGIDPKVAAKIRSIKQLRPLTDGQPWGIFFVEFEPKRLPVVALRRILRSLIIKKRHSADSAHRAAWHLNDLLFVSAYGESAERQMIFAHFAENSEGGDLPTLRVLGWDDADTALHLDYVHKELHENLCWPEEEGNLEAWRESWSSAFKIRHREVITTSKQMANELAELARAIRKRVNAILKIETENGPLKRLMAAFKEALIHDLNEDDFADMYAQTIAYGLLTARVSRPAGLVADDLALMVPVTNPFLKELLETFLSVGGRKSVIDFDELGINDVVELLREANMEAVLRDFGNLNPEEDPGIHFYELFLKEYDAKKRLQRGVFYTPKPVVSFIVRSVDSILKDEFALEYGLADTTTWGELAKRVEALDIPEGVSPDDPFVQILDPAAGTGTFLVEVIDVIYDTMMAKWREEGRLELELPQLWNEYVTNSLLPRLFGYELMMAPYAIAHMKIGLKLAETGYDFTLPIRARVFLTNTLEPPQDFSDRLTFDAPALANEAQAVNQVKENVPITVIIGNPPYSYMSANLTINARGWVDTYRYVNGNKIEEKGALVLERTLQDDYVKFIAYSQKLLAKRDIGILGMISNAAYLDNPLLRGMRSSLLSDCASIYAVNLHGDSKRDNDQNVFDIQTGVAITVGVFRPHVSEPTKSYRSDVIGSRLQKYRALSEKTCVTIHRETMEPSVPSYLFVKFTERNPVYDSWLSVNDIFRDTSNAIKTNRDHFVIGFSDDQIIRRLGIFINESLSTDEVKTQLSLKDNAQWSVEDGRNKCRVTFSKQNIYDLAYRPFDKRRIYYHPSVVFNPRPRTMKPMIKVKNLALLTTRRIRTEVFAHFFIVDSLCMAEMLSSADNCNAYPLYTIPSEGPLSETDNVHPNITSACKTEINEKLGLEWVDSGNGDLNESVGPTNLIRYIYALVHSPIYRNQYQERLRQDYPRIPITPYIDLFRSLCDLGRKLIALHLMESDKLNNYITTFHNKGDRMVTRVGEKGKNLARENDGKGRLYINDTAYFEGVPLELWNFHIGSHQVCHKWLYDRRKAGRSLSDEDVEHYHRILVALNETTFLMREIDESIDAHGGWPGAFVRAE